MSRPNVTVFSALLVVLLAFSFGLAAEPEFTVRGPGGAGGMYVPSFSPYDRGVVLLGTDMGAAFRSGDGGKSWRLIHYRNYLRYMQHSARPAYFPDKVFWNSGRRKLVVSRDSGVNWSEIKARPWEKERILHLAALPGLPDVLLVAAESALWRTEDDGRNWKRVVAEPSSGLAVLGDMVFSATPNGILLVSSDRGLTWDAKPIQVDGAPMPSGSVIAFSGSAGEQETLLLASIKGKGVLRSKDRGDTWEMTRCPSFDANILLPVPGQAGSAYVARSGAVKYNKVYRSVDGGMNWESVFRLGKPGALLGGGNVDPSWVQTELYWNYYVSNWGLALDPFDPSRLILATQGDLYLTDNGGDSWRQGMSRVVDAGEGPPRLASIGLEVTSAWKYYFDPVRADTHYIAYSDIGFLRSEDAGASWTWSAQGAPWKNTFYQLALDPETPGRIYAATSRRHDIPHYLALSKTFPDAAVHQGGVVVSDDFGKRWTVPYEPGKGRGLPKLACTTVALDPDSPKDSRTLYAGMFGEDDNAGVWKSTDGGRSWTRKSSGLGIAPNRHVYRIAIHPRSGNLYCLITGLRMKGANFTVPGGVWKSTDGGESWRHISAGSNLNWHATSMLLDPEDEKTILVTATSPPGHWLEGGLYRTRDGGESWQHILDDKELARVAGGSSFDHTMSVAVHPEDSNLIYVGTTHHGLVFSRNGGKSWESYESFPFNIVQSINVPPGDPGRIVVTTFGAGVWEGPHLPGRR
ncbi:WD40/YVTN/BNR-like repeat-containing protein [Salidesulfovibrio brasiliensis]|uniref:WD40/YVTN/BNR-like repeat-containing protein n=1 Tax=Salidesulfovibrio brasiliensis TaxID=221711 RepID=UPI0006CF2FA7|nr:exo-alpha-sialidase [Salidesulfovibrio brasiliensis]